MTEATQERKVMLAHLFRDLSRGHPGPLIGSQQSRTVMLEGHSGGGLLSWRQQGRQVTERDRSWDKLCPSKHGPNVSYSSATPSSS